MVPRENKNNAYAKFGGTNKEYYGIFRSGLLGGQTKCILGNEKIANGVRPLWPVSVLGQTHLHPFPSP